MKKALLFLSLSCSIAPLYCFETIQGFPSNREVIRRAGTFLPSNPIIIEAGTYDGKDTVELSSLLPKAQIFGFEPVLELFQKTKEAVKIFPNIKIYNFALSDKVGVVKMDLSGWGVNSKTLGMSSSLLPPKEHLKYARAVTFENKVEVQIITIDEWAERNDISYVDFLRLDIQGNELNVLMASPKIVSTAKVILTEVEFVESYEGQYLFEDVKAWLEG